MDFWGSPYFFIYRAPARHEECAIGASEWAWRIRMSMACSLCIFVGILGIFFRGLEKIRKKEKGEDKT